MKRKDRGFLIVSGVVSLASQLPSCKTTAPDSSSNELSVNNSAISCQKGSTTDQNVLDACRDLLAWAKANTRVHVNKITVSADDEVVIEVPNGTEVANMYKSLAVNVRLRRDMEGNWIYNAHNNGKGGSGGKGGGNGKGGFDANASDVRVFVQAFSGNGKGGDDDGGGNGKGGNNKGGSNGKGGN